MSKVRNFFHADSAADAAWRTAMLGAIVIVGWVVVLTFNRAGDTKTNQTNFTQTLSGFQQLADRGGCISDVYGRYYLAIADVIISGDTHSPQIIASKRELQGLIDGTVCPVPDIGVSVTTTTVATEP